MPLAGTEKILATAMMSAFDNSGSDRKKIFEALAKSILDHIVAQGQVVVVVGSPGPTTGKIL